MTLSYRRRVSNGARLLDRRVPGWWTAVDTRRLDSSSVRDCVLGQLVRAQAIRPIGLDWSATLMAVGLAPAMAVDFGFDARLTPLYYKSCARLDSYWRQEINRRASNQDRGRRARRA